MGLFSLSFSLFVVTLSTAGGFENYYVSRCVFNSSDVKDVEYIFSSYHRKMEVFRFSSSLGRFVGLSVYGLKLADCWNNDPKELNKWRALKATFCLEHVRAEYQSFLTKAVQPSVRIHAVTPPAGRHPAMLVCSVYDFYPKNIRVSLLRDGQEVTSDVTSSDELANGDWYYQVQSYLEYTPRSGEKISCKVEHASLMKPLIKDWDPLLPESERNKIAIGASGLILGLILSLAGFISYRRKVHGRILVPTS